MLLLEALVWGKIKSKEAGRKRMTVLNKMDGPYYGVIYWNQNRLFSDLRAEDFLLTNHSFRRDEFNKA